MPSKKIYTIILVFFAIIYPAACPAQQAMPAIQYLFGIDATASGNPLTGVQAIAVDNANGELYLLDDSNRRIVITDINGTFLHQFTYTDAGLKSSPRGLALADDGTIYIAEDKRIVITTYSGVHKKDMYLSTIPDVDRILIQSIAIEGDIIYIGDGANSRVIVMDRKKESFLRQFKDGLGHNIYLAMDEDGIYLRDPATFSIIHIDKQGRPLGRFGTVSSLAGGFSMPVDIAVDREKGWVIVLDTNRLMLIFFDRQGNFLFEFGGPDIFKWPRAVAVDNNNRVYVADATQKIRVFQVIQEKPAEEAKKTEVPAPPPPPEPADEVTKIAEAEQRLLPVSFDVNSSKLKEADKLILEKDAQWLKKNPDVKIHVQTYADGQGAKKANIRLSKGRAKAVMDYLVKLGVDKNRLKFIGYGREPKAKSNGGSDKSRRVDFLIAKK